MRETSTHTSTEPLEIWFLYGNIAEYSTNISLSNDER